MLHHFFLLALGIVLVNYGAKYLVSGASSVAKRFKVSDLAIGLTIVAFGTSAPELVVSVVAAKSGQADVAIGNVVGSNLVNICLILGFSAILAPLRIHSSTVWKEIPFSLMGIIVAFLVANDILIDNDAPSVISRSDGLVLLCFLFIYLYYMFEMALENPVVDNSDSPQVAVWLAVAMVVGGVVALAIGGDVFVESAVEIARWLGVSEAVIGLTLVSIGTSVPELATSIVAARRGNADLVVGNVVGSNIFNVFMILGLSAVIAPLPLAGITATDFGTCVFATILLFVFCLKKPRVIFRWKGIVFLLIYATYISYLLANL